MTQLGASTYVQGVPLSPPAISLLNAAIVENETDERWVNGLHYVPEAGGVAEVFELCDNDPDTGFTKTIVAASTPLTGTPHGIVAQDTCSTFSYQARDYQARATRQLLAMESRLIAAELWEGTLGLNPFLADPTATVATGTASPESLLYAIGTIEEAFYATSTQRCMIHMRANVLEAIQTLSGGAALRREGNTFYTQLDSVVSVDRGYTGTGPSGQAVTTTQEWIYATAVVQIRHSPVVVFPDRMPEAVLRRENQVTFFAERAVHAAWDYNTPTIALNVKRNG